MSNASTVLVELTPAGRAAVAVIVVAGPDAARAVGDCFRPVGRRGIAEAPIGRILLGRWGDEGGEELIVCRRDEQTVEVHCHGGSAAVRAVVDRLVERGCTAMSWQDWLLRLEDGPIRSAARVALAEAPTARTAAVLLEQHQGALEDAVRQALAAVATANWAGATQVIDRVLRFGDVGLHLTTPWRVVLAGPPNVGKSSLLNAMAGYQRAIVSPQPGTTRDVVTMTTAIDGWPVQLADTAGLRDSQDALESAGVALAGATIDQADLVVLVHDASEERGVGKVERCEPGTVSGEYRLRSTEYGVHEWERICPSPTAHRPLLLRVCNKIDLVSAADRALLAASPAIPTSAVTGEGIAELLVAIGEALMPAAPPAGAAIAFTVQQVELLQKAHTAVGEHNASAARVALQALLPCGEEG